MINMFDQGTSAYQLQQNPIRPTRRSLDLSLMNEQTRFNVVSNMLPPIHPGSPSTGTGISSLNGGLHGSLSISGPPNPHSLQSNNSNSNNNTPNGNSGNSSNSNSGNSSGIGAQPPRPRERFKSFSWTVGESNNSNSRLSELSMIQSKSKSLKNEFTVLYDILKTSDHTSSAMQIDQQLCKHHSKFKTLLIQNNTSHNKHLLSNILKRRGHVVTTVPLDLQYIRHIHNKEQFSLFIYNATATDNCTDHLNNLSIPFSIEKQPDATPTNHHTHSHSHAHSASSIHANSSSSSPSATNGSNNHSNNHSNSNISNGSSPSHSSSKNNSYFYNIESTSINNSSSSSSSSNGTNNNSNNNINSTAFRHAENIEFVKTLRSIVGPYCVILAISESSSPIEFSSLIDAGVNDYIPQPLTSVLVDVRLTCAERLIADHHYLMKADEITDGAKRITSCIEYSNDGVEIWDPNGHIKYLNYTTSDSIGYSRWEILGKEFSFLIDNHEIIPQMWATITGGKPWNGYIRTKHANGTLVYFESSVSPVYDTQQKLIYYNCTKRDATQKRIDEEFKTQEQERTIETSRLRLSMMSHDIRTPMSGIIGMTDLLAETELHPQQRHYLDIIRASSNTLLNIINDLLDISKIEAGKLEIENRDFDFRETVEDVCELMGERAQAKALSLMCFVHPNIPQNLIGDSSRLKQILNNLLGNSVKFTDNGEILVVCNVIDISEDIVTLRIEVKDTGIGIKKEALPLLFKAFTQAEGSIARQYAGSGLGLAICKELANLAFNGDVGVESQYGVGSTFWTVLNFKLVNPINSSMPVGVALSKSPINLSANPIHDPMSIAPSEGTALQHEDLPLPIPLGKIDLARECTISSENPPNFNGIRVLLIERNANQRNFLTQQMGVWNISLDSTDDVGDALLMCESAQSKMHSYAFAIIDLATVGNDALLLAQKLIEQSKSRGNMLHLILMLPLKMRSPQLEEEARRSGFGEIVTKPIRMSVLLDSLKSLSGLQRQKTIRHNAADLNPVSPHDKLEIRVLVVDDNMVNRQVACKMLQSMGCNVDVVSSGMEALDRNEKGTYDMIFLDIMMPGMDGFQVTKEIRERELKRSGNKHIPIIAMTANAFKEDEVKCINSGMDDYLSKPIKINEFRLLMSKWRQNIFLSKSHHKIGN